MNRIIIILITLVVGYCSLAPKKQFPQKKYFILQPAEEKIKKYPKKLTSLRVVKFRISKLYENKGLVYKKSDVSYDSDFYNEFLIPPTQLLTERVEDWLLKSGMVEQTAGRTRFLEAEYILEGYIHSLYGDFTDKQNPRAILGIDFYLIDNNSMGIKFSTKLMREQKLKQPTAEQLVKGWNIALTEILVRFNQELSNASLRNNKPKNKKPL